DEIGGGDVAVLSRHRPQAREHHEHERINQDGVGHREERDRARAERQRRHRDEGIGGVKIAAEKEPGYDSAKATARETAGPVYRAMVPTSPPPTQYLFAFGGNIAGGVTQTMRHRKMPASVQGGHTDATFLFLAAVVAMEWHGV